MVAALVLRQPGPVRLRRDRQRQVVAVAAERNAPSRATLSWTNRHGYIVMKCYITWMWALLIAKRINEPVEAFL